MGARGGNKDPARSALQCFPADPRPAALGFHAALDFPDGGHWTAVCRPHGGPFVEPEGGEGALHVPGPVGVCQRPAGQSRGSQVGTGSRVGKGSPEGLGSGRPGP